MNHEKRIQVITEKLDEISKPFGTETMIAGFRKTAEYFEDGINYLRKAIDESDREEFHKENLKDIDICRAYMHHLISAANYSEFVYVRNKWLETKEPGFKNKLIVILNDELKNTEEMLKLLKKDSRIGYEGSIGYFYMPFELIEKIYDIKCSLVEMGGKGVKLETEY